MNGRSDRIALLAHPGEDDDIGAVVRRTAAALARATVARGHRIVLHADAGTLLAAVLAAFEVRPPVTVEGGETLPPPLILWPSLPTEGVEEELFRPGDAEQAGLLDLLASLGMVDQDPFRNFREEPRSGALFTRLFEDWRPRTIVALGPRWSLGVAIEGADRYRRDQDNVGLFLARGLSRGEPWTDQGWRDLESIVSGREARIEPTLFGEPVADEALRDIARLASLESLLALAVERLAAGETEGNTGEPEPSPESPRSGGGGLAQRLPRERIKAGA
ncbi:MAG TPA: hypothetical protein VGM86_06940 [Thermoanaerobaculia bacterium]|jgi:hypothetical protein